MRARTAYALGALSAAVTYAAGKVLAQVVFKRSVIYPTSKEN